MGAEPRAAEHFPRLWRLNPQDFLDEPAQFQTQIQKTSATGAIYTATSTIGYDFQNASRAFPSDWTTNFQVQVRQPLLQGAGAEFNRIAGPNATAGVYNGVVLARINTDIALAAFEGSVRNLVLDVETAYWELYFAYRNLDAVVAGRNSALETWRRIHALYVVSAKGGEADKEAQAREQYYLFRSSVETSLAGLYSAESKLRYMMGLAATDGRLIRPADEPTTAKVTFDWADTHAEALCRSVELREQRWKVKQRGDGIDRGEELSLAAAGRRGQLHVERHGSGAARRGRQRLRRLSEPAPWRLPKLALGVPGDHTARFPQGAGGGAERSNCGWRGRRRCCKKRNSKCRTRSLTPCATWSRT